MALRERSNLTGETHAGVAVSFSYEAYTEAFRLYKSKDIEAIAKKLEDGVKEKRGVFDFLRHFGVHKEKGQSVPEEVANFFRDFAIIQEFDHPDFDRGNAIGSLATRIELALDQVPTEKLTQEFFDQHTDACRDYENLFG